MDKLKDVLALVWHIWQNRHTLTEAFEYVPLLEVMIRDTVELLDGDVTMEEVQRALDNLKDIPEIIDGIQALAEEAGLLKYE